MVAKGTMVSAAAVPAKRGTTATNATEMRGCRWGAGGRGGGTGWWGAGAVAAGARIVNVKEVKRQRHAARDKQQVRYPQRVGAACTSSAQRTKKEGVVVQRKAAAVTLEGKPRTRSTLQQRLGSECAVRLRHGTGGVRLLTVIRIAGR